MQGVQSFCHSRGGPEPAPQRPSDLPVLHPPLSRCPPLRFPPGTHTASTASDAPRTRFPGQCGQLHSPASHETSARSKDTSSPAPAIMPTQTQPCSCSHANMNPALLLARGAHIFSRVASGARCPRSNSTCQALSKKPSSAAEANCSQQDKAALWGRCGRHQTEHAKEPPLLRLGLHGRW